MKLALVCAVTVLFALPASADEKKFAYSYEAKVLPKAVLEFEQWLTLHSVKGPGTQQFWQIREEFEYGITDLLTTALYINLEYENIKGVPGMEDEAEFEFEGISSEWKYKLADPSVDPIGFLLYGELSIGPDESELEFKAVFSKHVQKWTLACNFIIEIEREEEVEPSGEKEMETETVFATTLGASYDLEGGLAVGLEILHELAFEGFYKEQEANSFFVGPNLSYATGKWYVVGAFLKQVDTDPEEEFQFRIVGGIIF